MSQIPPPGPAVSRVLHILRAGDVVPEVAARHGEFAGWIERAVASVWPGTFEVHDLRSDEPLPGARSTAGMIITGSISSVTEREPWMLRSEAYIRDLMAAQVPLFGICFGHQLMAQALGGDVRKNPLGREMGTVQVTRLADDPLFAGIEEPFFVNATHVDSVIEPPSGARVIATTAKDDKAVIWFGPVARGVQFHPEIDGDAMRSYVEARWPVLAQEGLDPEAMRARVCDTPNGREMLRNFVRSFVLPRESRAA
jgi:GMP synthase (glutamine-hydrolysing)